MVVLEIQDPGQFLDSSTFGQTKPVEYCNDDLFQYLFQKCDGNSSDLDQDSNDVLPQMFEYFLTTCSYRDR